MGAQQAARRSDQKGFPFSLPGSFHRFTSACQDDIRYKASPGSNFFFLSEGHDNCATAARRRLGD